MQKFKKCNRKNNIVTNNERNKIKEEMRGIMEEYGMAKT